MTVFRPIFLALLLLSQSAFAVMAQSQRANGMKLAEAIAAINKDDWQSASRIVAGINDDAAKIYLNWRKLRAGKGNWSEYPRFLIEHGDWPGLPLLRRAGEARIPTGRPANEIVAYFDTTPPQTGRGALRLAEALENLGRKSEAREVLITAWTGLRLSDSERNALLSRYKSILKDYHWARTDQMLWEGETRQANAMLPLLTNGQKRLTEARVALRRNKSSGLGKLIDAVPASLRDDPGLAFERFRWRMRKDMYAGAHELITAQSGSREKLHRPDIWSDRRRRLTRYYMREKSYKTAYTVAARHFLKSGESGYTDLEWLSGYIALIYLNKPADAVTHFRNLREVAVTPITQGRVWYWLGRAHAANGNTEKAQEAYEVAARYQTSFYGQLAAEAGEMPAQPVLNGKQLHDWRAAPFLASTVFRAGLLLHYAQERYAGGRFFAHMAETMTEAEQQQLGQFLVDLNRPNMALRVAKNGARMGRIIMPAYYPVTSEFDAVKIVPRELALAIARQETEFNPEAESPAGARGLMQLMPRTAKGVAKSKGLPYSATRLITDPSYNVVLGTGYLRQMLDRYNGSYVLAAAAYNAGPHRADSWIGRFGDPRKADVDAIRWIEKIPFRETRNYVMRVLESVGVYRARITGDPGAVSISRDLARGG